MTGKRFVILVVVALGACGNDKTSDGEVTSAPAVKILNFQFEPKSLTVKAGTTVTWTNEDTAVHSIKDTSSLATPVSPDLGKSDTFTITYGQPGSYSYICGIHQYMTGTVAVT